MSGGNVDPKWHRDLLANVTFGTWLFAGRSPAAMPNDRAPLSDNRIVAVGLLTRREVTMFGTQLSRLYPLEHDDRFADLLEAIDEADHALQRGKCRSD